MNAPSTPPLVFNSVREFLTRHAPFSRMKADALAFLIPRLKLAYFAKDTLVVDRHTGLDLALHIIEKGEVASETAGLDTLPDRILSPGECFPVGSLAAGGSPTRRYRALDDVFAYLLSADDFRALRAMSPEFEAYCTEAVTTLAQQSLAELQRHYSQVAADQHTLTRHLGDLVRRELVTCGVDATLREAIAAMREHAVRSVVVVDAKGAAAGIFTLNDLRDRVMLQEIPLTAALTEVMTREPFTLPTNATAADAIQQMAQSGFHQVIVAEQGRAMGIVSERDLFALQRVSLGQISHSIRNARNVAGLKRVASDIRNLSDNLLAQGVAVEALTRTIASLNDALTRQAITLVLADHPLTGIDWCWLSLGSEGRGEQTLATDQDNAILFADADDRAGVRDRRELLAFAREVNDALDSLGFPLCKGGIMASNPEWCLTEHEWRERFTRWISEPTPPALLNANIFFDFRALYGDSTLADNLMAWLLPRTQENKVFLRLMVQNALETEPPLGLIRAFAVDDDAPYRGTLDLKTRGTRIFVDAARVFALALGIRDTNTAERIRKAGAALKVDTRYVDATIDAFHYLQVLRLSTQRGPSPATPNRIDPYALNEVDQRMLKEAFRQARKLQQRLKETYSFAL